MRIQIGKRFIGETYPCFIIAEAGVNHNGDIHTALKMIDVAQKIGADAIKFQTYKTENLVCRELPMAAYQKKNLNNTEDQFQMLKKYELSREQFEVLKNHCDKKNIIFLSTPHTDDAVKILNPLVKAFKIGSGDLTNIPFLKRIAKLGKPIILSTGMSDLKDIKTSIHSIKSQRNNKIILLHCTSNYPCPLNEVNLRAMLNLKNTFNLPVGYSDHTLGFLIPVIATALGASIIEKHFTLNKKSPGPDHKASMGPNDFHQMIKMIRDTEKALGTYQKKLTENEKIIKSFITKTLTAKNHIVKGQIIREKMLEIKRAGPGGIMPKYIDKIIGKKAKAEINKDEQIKWNMF